MTEREYYKNREKETCNGNCERCAYGNGDCRLQCEESYEDWVDSLTDLTRLWEDDIY